MLEGDVMKEETSIVFIVVEKGAEVEKVEETEEDVEVVDATVGPRGPDGSAPFFLGPLTGIPIAGAADVPAAGPASCATTRGGMPSTHASGTNQLPFISKAGPRLMRGLRMKPNCTGSTHR